MKNKINFLFICLAALTLVFAACNSQNKKDITTEQSSNTANVIYTCPMHPEVTGDKPGKCHKCGMDLIIKESTDSKTGMNMDSTEMKNMKK